MGAGSIDVSRSESFYHREKGTDGRSVNRKCGVEFKGDWGLGARDDAHSRNHEKIRDFGGFEFEGLCRKRKVGECCSDARDGALTRRGTTYVGCSVVLPAPTQKKFSPIMLDGEYNKLALSSKMDVDAEIISEVSSPNLGSNISGKLQAVADDSPGCVDSSSSGLTYLNDEQEPRLLVEEDALHGHGPNLSTSRWAYDDMLDEDLYLDGDLEPIKGMRTKNEANTTNIDLQHSEGSVLTSDRSSGSDGCRVPGAHCADEFPENESETDEHVDMSVSQVEALSAGRSELEIEKVVVPRSAEQSGTNMLQSSRSVFEYDKLGKISEGSYGIVYKARDKHTGEIVALKKLKMMGSEREGIPLYYLREINSLLSFNHPSVLRVKEVVVDDNDVAGFNNIFMVMEYMEHDLKGLLEARKQHFSQSEVKCLMLQLLEGVKYLHDHWVLHRDLKTSNLLLNNEGVLKIGDFGMSREYGSPLKAYTALVVTLWYRAPELLLGVREYSTAVDMWSVGCIMAELLSSRPIFDGKTELDQIDKIFKILGTPNEKIWPGYSKFPGAKANFVQQPYNLLRKKFPLASFTGSSVLSELGFDLLSKFLTYDPEKRITAEQALNHGWFREVPLPKSKEFMPTFPAQHGQKR